MGYIKAEDIFPDELIAIIQQYIDGETIYIPRKPERRLKWGDNTGISRELSARNNKIYDAYMSGKTINELSKDFCLSVKSIQRIIHEMR